MNASLGGKGYKMSMHRVGTVTLLFTDLVGSTELLERLGDDAADELRHVHFDLLRGAVSAVGGQEVKNLGDGLMIVFSSALDAVECAVRMQQAVHEHNLHNPDRRLMVRIGLHGGDTLKEEDDYFGRPVVVAKRLCDSAQGGQILASDLVESLVGSRGNYEFKDLGWIALKGLGAPMPAREIVWEPRSEPYAEPARHEESRHEVRLEDQEQLEEVHAGDAEARPVASKKVAIALGGAVVVVALVLAFIVFAGDEEAPGPTTEQAFVPSELEWQRVDDPARLRRPGDQAINRVAVSRPTSSICSSPSSRAGRST